MENRNIQILNRQKTVEISLPRINRKIQQILNALGYEHHEISLVFTDDEHIRELNRSYRGSDAATNVLSFSMLEGDFPEMGGNLLGDLVISAPTAQREAQGAEISLEERLSQLLVHGILHLVGYDHESGEEDEEKMIQKSLELLHLLEPNSDLNFF